MAGILAPFSASLCQSQGFTINTIAGGGSDHACNGEPPLQMQFSGPTVGIAFDAAGNLYVANTSADQICKIAGGAINLVARRMQGYTGDGGPATAAGLDNPFAVAVGNGTAGYSGTEGRRPARSSTFRMPWRWTPPETCTSPTIPITSSAKWTPRA